MKSRLHIHVGSNLGKTFLNNSFCSQPFKVADITEDRSTGSELRLMIMTSSPGILDNDNYSINIELDERANVSLETQSYQRLFRMKTGAQQKLELHMKPFSSFEFIPHPCVPYECSSFVSRNSIHLSDNCSLIWGEIVTCGRKLNDEIFRFSKYQSVTEIYLSQKLIAKENVLIAPSLINVSALGQLEGYTHQASLLCIGKGFSSEAVLSNIFEQLAKQENICVGVSSLEHGCVVRLFGYHAEQMYHCARRVSPLLKAANDAQLPIKTFAHAG